MAGSSLSSVDCWTSARPVPPFVRSFWAASEYVLTFEPRRPTLLRSSYAHPTTLIAQSGCGSCRKTSSSSDERSFYRPAEFCLSTSNGRHRYVTRHVRLPNLPGEQLECNSRQGRSLE